MVQESFAEFATELVEQMTKVIIGQKKHSFNLKLSMMKIMTSPITSSYSSPITYNMNKILDFVDLLSNLIAKLNDDDVCALIRSFVCSDINLSELHL